MNELLFEAYQVPSVNYGLDALFSAYFNNIRDDGLIVSSGRTTTVVVPLVGGRGLLDNAKRYVLSSDAVYRGVGSLLLTSFCASCSSSILRAPSA